MKKILSAIIALSIVLALPVFASADNSPSGTEESKVTVIDVEGGTCEKTKNEDGSYIIKANVKDGYKFTGWTINGQYEFVSGSLSTPTITIKISSDVTVTPSYENQSGSSAGSADSSGTAPRTGDSDYSTAIVFTILAFVAAVGIILGKNKLCSSEE